ncbi:MAG: S26 family signal peptidase [Pirellulaceae bacterium]
MFRNRLIRKLISAALGLGLLLLVGRLVVYRGMLRPVRVSSGSMAETLIGAHYRVVCDECGLAFACDRDQPPRGMTAVCPNCGFGGIALEAEQRQQGQRVLIDQLATLTHLRRWEVVAYNDPHLPRQMTVKRVVGLPGEEIAIRAGDLYVDGRIARKNLRQQQDLAVLVHDNDFRPRQNPPLPDRWQADASNSRWRAHDGGFTFSGEGESAGESAGEDSSQSGEASTLDWLTYRHWRCVLTPLPRTEEAPIRDNYGYNQGVARALHITPDLMLVCQLRLAGEGELVVRCDNGRDALQAVIQPAAGRVALLREGRQVAQAEWPAAQAGKSVELVFSMFDRQVILAVDQRVLLTHPLSALPEASDKPLTPTSRPFAFGAQDVRASVEHLRIYRDLYYLAPRGLDVPWETERRLADDEVFVLGDNVPISRDSRALDRPLKSDAVIGGITRYD